MVVSGLGSWIGLLVWVLGDCQDMYLQTCSVVLGHGSPACLQVHMWTVPSTVAHGFWVWGFQLMMGIGFVVRGRLGFRLSI